MMHDTSTPYYQTDNSKINRFSDFIDNNQEEKDELKKVKRSFRKNKDELGMLGQRRKYKYNRVTRKMDDDSKAEIEDKIEEIEEIFPDSNHKYKLGNIEESVTPLEDLRINFRNWETSDVNALTEALKERHPDVDVDLLHKLSEDWISDDLMDDNMTYIKSFESFKNIN